MAGELPDGIVLCIMKNITLRLWTHQVNLMGFLFLDVEESGLPRIIWDDKHTGSNPVVQTMLGLILEVIMSAKHKE